MYFQEQDGPSTEQLSEIGVSAEDLKTAAEKTGATEPTKPAATDSAAESVPDRTVARAEGRARDRYYSLTEVGPDKPLGYMPVKALVKGGGIPGLVKGARDKGLGIKWVDDPIRSFLTSSGGLGSVYFYDYGALAELTAKNRETLEKAGWSAEPSKFIDDVAHKQAEPHTPLFDVVADAFGDYDNVLRMEPGKNQTEA